MTSRLPPTAVRLCPCCGEPTAHLFPTPDGLACGNCLHEAEIAEERDMAREYGE